MRINTDALKKYVIPNLPYVLIFWFCDKLGMAYRLSPGVDFLQKLTGSVRTINTAFTNPLPSFVPFDLLVGIGGAALIFFVVAQKKKNAKKYRKDVEYGSARWGNAEDIKPYMDTNPQNNIILTQTEGLTMNSRPKNPKHARNKNVLVVGGSGSGKTRFLNKPNLMQCQSKNTRFHSWSPILKAPWSSRRARCSSGSVIRSRFSTPSTLPRANIITPSHTCDTRSRN